MRLRKLTREEKKQKAKEVARAILMLVVISLCIIGITSRLAERKAIELANQTIETVLNEEQENPYEAEIIKLRLLESIGKFNEESVFGYNFTELVGIIYHESGGDYELAKKIATCVHNAQVKHMLTMNPVEICEAYNYTYDMGYYGSKTLCACIEVFVDCEYDAEVGNATMFYNPNMLGGASKSHESQKYVCSYIDDKYGEIRFFEEN